VARQIYAQSSRAIPLRGRGEGYTQRDGELRGFFDASVGCSPHLLYALMADRGADHLPPLSRDRGPLPTLGLNENAASSPLSRRQTYEVVLRAGLNGRRSGASGSGCRHTPSRGERGAAPS
jgi:hypothetical protein